MIWLLSSAIAAPQEPVKCCNNPIIQQQLKSYLKVEAQLADGAKVGLINASFYGWHPRVDKARKKLSGPDRQAMDQLTTLTHDLKNADLQTIRTDFVEISRLMSFLVLRSPGGSKAVYEAHCADKPWLQSQGSELRSPYGACGSWRVPTP